MTNFLTIFGAITMAAAIVGGGLSASGVQIPVVSSIGRQILLFALGAVLVFTSFGKDNEGTGVETAARDATRPSSPTAELSSSSLPSTIQGISCPSGQKMVMDTCIPSDSLEPTAKGADNSIGCPPGQKMIMDQCLPKEALSSD